MTCKLTIDDIRQEPAKLLSKGRWANADVFIINKNGQGWVVKDFSKRFIVIRYLLAAWMIWRELRALQRLAGVEGVPAEGHRIGRWAIAYRYVPGITVSEARKSGMDVGSEFFLALEELVRRLHDANVVHLDVRNGKNILVTENREPALIDFQGAMFLDHTPARLARFLCDIDMSGVYKFWIRMSPETMGEERVARMEYAMRFRSFWRLRGYPGKQLLRFLRHGRSSREKARWTAEASQHYLNTGHENEAAERSNVASAQNRSGVSSRVGPSK